MACGSETKLPLLDALNIEALHIPNIRNGPPTKTQSMLRLLLCLVFASMFILQAADIILLRDNSLTNAMISEKVTNATLGFGAIYAVSRRGSPRQESLLRAAALTQIKITIPEQPDWQMVDVERIQARANSSLDYGSALAWLGHLNALSRFLKSHEETALIIEDDVDWDTHLRTEQMPQIAYAIREYLNSHEAGQYGDTNLWDVIWFGHCGDFFDASRGSQISKIKSFTDPTMPVLSKLHPWTRNFMREIGAVQDHQRLIHESVRPLCTFAYAVTRRSAGRIVNKIAVREPVRPLDGESQAFDVRMLEGCRDEGLKCITVNPELIHHMQVESEIAMMTDVVKRDRTEDHRMRSELETPNVRCSARSDKWSVLKRKLIETELDPQAAVQALAQAHGQCYVEDL